MISIGTVHQDCLVHIHKCWFFVTYRVSGRGDGGCHGRGRWNRKGGSYPSPNYEYIIQFVSQGVWSTSTSTREMYTNNIMMAASVLFSGNNWQKIDDFCAVFHLTSISKRTFELIQRKYLFPAVDDFYIRCQELIFR